MLTKLSFDFNYWLEENEQIRGDSDTYSSYVSGYGRQISIGRLRFKDPHHKRLCIIVNIMQFTKENVCS